MTLKNLNGGLPLKRSLSDIKNLAWLRTLALLGLGGLVVVMHARFRWPLRLPGHHGLEFIALLVIGRLSVQTRWASTVSGLGAAGLSLLPVWGFGDPFRWLIYLLPAVLIDLAYNRAKTWGNKVWFLTLLGGLAYAAKPLVRVVIAALSGWPYPSLIKGLTYPLTIHLLYGMAGGLVGAMVVLGIKRVGRAN